ncbi:MAG: antitoxin, RHH family protein [Acidobacteria bacterium]|nr:antitoxin, RHH family protein [Acidobacteriota bacterium]
MPAKSPRITTVVDEELAHWLRRRSEIEGRSVSLVVRDIIAKYYADEEERFWAHEGESRLATFDRQTAVSHEDAWD